MKIHARPLMIVALLCMTAVADEPAAPLRKLIDDSVAWYEVFPGEATKKRMVCE